MNKQFAAWMAVFTTSVLFSVTWHVVFFQDAYLRLGVYSRMNEPLYHWGLVAWILETVPFVSIYFRTEFSRKGRWEALKYSWWLAVFTAAPSVAGVAAKVRIDDMTLWFLLAGGFVFFHFTLMGLVLGQWCRPVGTGQLHPQLHLSSKQLSQ